MTRSLIYRAPGIGRSWLLASTMAVGTVAQAELDLGWERAGSVGPPGPGCADAACTTVVHQNQATVTGQTPFVYEVVRDQGVNYYHLIVGDPAQGFAQEVYIEVGGGGALQGGSVGLLSGTSSSAGRRAVDVGIEGSGFSPLDADQSFSGNSTGNPSRVVMRQFMSDGELTVDFIKDDLLEKPTIHNIISTPEMVATFILDGRGNPYTTASASPLTNEVNILSPDVPPGAAIFDATLDAQHPRSTAGQYTAPNPPAGQPGGSYTYADAHEDVNLDPDWHSFFDHRETNPWAYTENRPVAP